MILKDSFYTINALTLDDQVLEANITIDANHAIFDGHFPGNPVTPGVIQLELVKELLSTHFERKMELKTLANSKFLAVLNPVNTPEVVVKMTLIGQEDATWKVSGQLLTSEAICLKFSGIWG
jgi:3-hydroxyacyl-[acyl-carrier-protein] dehydratase